MNSMTQAVDAIVNKLIGRVAEIDYVNWRGDRRVRKIIPLHFVFGVSPYHEGEQWICRAMDVEDGKEKDFALSGVKGWR